MRARLVFRRSGASGMDDKKSVFLGVFRISARTCQPSLRAVTLAVPLFSTPLWPCFLGGVWGREEGGSPCRKRYCLSIR